MSKNDLKNIKDLIALYWDDISKPPKENINHLLVDFGSKIGLYSAIIEGITNIIARSENEDCDN